MARGSSCSLATIKPPPLPPAPAFLIITAIQGRCARPFRVCRRAINPAGGFEGRNLEPARGGRRRRRRKGRKRRARAWHYCGEEAWRALYSCAMPPRPPKCKSDSRCVGIRARHARALVTHTCVDRAHVPRPLPPAQARCQRQWHAFALGGDQRDGKQGQRGVPACHRAFRDRAARRAKQFGSRSRAASPTRRPCLRHQATQRPASIRHVFHTHTPPKTSSIRQGTRTCGAAHAHPHTTRITQQASHHTHWEEGARRRGEGAPGKLVGGRGGGQTEGCVNGL